MGCSQCSKRYVALHLLCRGQTPCCHVRRRCSNTRRGLCDSRAGNAIASILLCRRRIHGHDHIHEHSNTRVSKAKKHPQTRGTFYQLSASRKTTDVARTPQGHCTAQYLYPHTEQWLRCAHEKEAYWARRRWDYFYHQRGPGREGCAGAEKAEPAREIALSLCRHPRSRAPEERRGERKKRPSTVRPSIQRVLGSGR